MTAKHWWRLELDAKGKVLSCVRVEQVVKAETEGFLYVQATSEKQAGRRAFNEYMRLRTAAQRKKLISEGKCAWCCRKNDREATKRCSRCLTSDLEHCRRYRARRRGEEVEPANKAATIAARAQEQRQSIRAEEAGKTRLLVLLEVQKTWENAPSNGRFTAWLQAQISAHGGRRVA